MPWGMICVLARREDVRHLQSLLSSRSFRQQQTEHGRLHVDGCDVHHDHEEEAG